MIDRIPSKERGCKSKMKLKGKLKDVRNKARKLALKYRHQLGVYDCPHCKYFHTTTKIESASLYGLSLLYVTPLPELEGGKGE